MTNPNLVIHNDELRYRFQNDNQISRLSGQWIDNNQVKNLDDKNYYVENIFDLNINFFKWLNTYDAPINLLVFFIFIYLI